MKNGILKTKKLSIYNFMANQLLNIINILFKYYNFFFKQNNLFFYFLYYQDSNIYIIKININNYFLFMILLIFKYKYIVV